MPEPIPKFQGFRFGFQSIILLPALLLAGCGTVKPQVFYGPPRKPASEVARLWCDKGAPLYPVKVDGTRITGTMFNWQVVEVLPGTHRVVVSGGMGDTWETRWVAKAGKNYKVDLKNRTSTGPSTFTAEFDFPEIEAPVKLK